MFDHESYDGTPEIPHDFFSNKSLGPLLGCLRPGENGCGFLTDFFNQFGMVKSLHRILFLGGFTVDGWCMTGSQKQVSKRFHDHFHMTLLVVEIITAPKMKSIQGNHLEPQSQPCINGCFNQLDEPNLYIENVWNAPNFHPSIGKNWGRISGVPGRA